LIPPQSTTPPSRPTPTPSDDLPVPPRSLWGLWWVEGRVWLADSDPFGHRTILAYDNDVAAAQAEAAYNQSPQLDHHGRPIRVRAAMMMLRPATPDPA
jgi:hypothetical protein